MKYIIAPVLFFSTFLFPVKAQEKLPKFGQVDKALLEMQACDFDKTAGAMVVFDEAESFFKLNLHDELFPVYRKTEHRKRIKIFNKKDLDVANIVIKYFNSKYIYIDNIVAQTYNLDAAGNIIISKVEKSNIYHKEINKIYKETIFAFPDVKEGSVIEFSYVMEGMSEGKWYFQSKIPVKLSRFIVNFPEELSVSAVTKCTMPLSNVKKESGKNISNFYSMENIPAFRDEPFMTTPLDYLQQIEFRIARLKFPGRPDINMLKSWPRIIKELIDDEDFGVQLKKDISRTAELDNLLNGIHSDLDKIKIIHKYVRENMKWNDRDNIWALEGVKKAWNEKSGTSGEINLILINLMKDVGIDVKPVLVSTADNGIINTSVPGYEQFNKVMAYVELNNKQYVLDATETKTPTHLIPLSVMGSEGLLIDKIKNYEWGWKALWDAKRKISKSVYINAAIDDKKVLKGTANITSYDYQKLRELEWLSKGVDILKQQKFTEPNTSIENYAVKNEKIDTLPLIEDFNFSIPTHTAGEYNYFSTNNFSGLIKNSFIDDERKTDIFFGALQDYVITSLITIPEGSVIEDLPKNVKMVTPDNAIIFQRLVQLNENMLNVRISLQVNSPIFFQDTYGELKEFYKKMYEILNEKFVYKKK